MAGHEPRLLDLCFERDRDRAVRRAIAAFRPELVAIGVRNLDNADAVKPVSYVNEARDLVTAVRRATSAPVVVGGAAVSCMPREMTERLHADYGLTGDGEASLPALLCALERKAPVREVPGVIFRDGTQFTDGAPASRAAFGPSHRALLRHVAMRRYVRHGALVPVQSKRGCPHRCTYCTYRHLEGARYRERDPDDVAHEIATLQASGFPTCEMVDAIFTQPESYLRALCEALRRARVRPALSASSVNPGGLSRADLLLMQEAGFRSITLSVESAAPAVLERMKKGFGADAVRRVAESLRGIEMRALWVFLFGAPGETRETMAETLDFLAGALRPGDVAYLGFGVRVYPGTDLADELGWPRETLLDQRCYFSADLDRRDAFEMICAFQRKRPEVVIPFETTSRLEPFAVRLLATLGVRPPYWRFARQVHVVAGMLGASPRARPLAE